MQYTILDTEPACISSRRSDSIIITRCSESNATGVLVETEDSNGLEVIFYSSESELIKLLAWTDDGTITGIPARIITYCSPEVVYCAATNNCDSLCI